MTAEEKKYLTKQELKVLYEHFKNEWISYDNDQIISLMKKISTIIHDEKLDTEGSRPTC